MNPKKIYNFIVWSDNERSRFLKKNITGIIALKGVNVFISFLFIPMTLGYLTPVEYGIWLTLNSILTWIGVLDLGLGMGLKNRIAEAYAINDLKCIRAYVSTAFLVLTILTIIIYLLFFLINRYINWGIVLGIDHLLGEKMSLIMLWAMLFMCMQFVVRIIGVITMANQQPVLNDFINVIGNFVILCIIGLLVLHTEKGSLFEIVIVSTSIPVLVYLVASCILFKTKYRNISPMFESIDMNRVKDIMNLGSKFFIIQIATMLIFSSSNIVISHTLGAENVTIYNIAYKYFSIVIMLFSIISSPLWPAFTDAYVKKDTVWINSTMRKMKKIWAFFVFVILLLLLCSDLFYKYWIGDEIEIPFSVSISMAVYVVIFTFHCLYVYPINGIGKIYIVWLYSMLSIVLYIPLSIFLCKLWGVPGVIMASSILLFPQTVLSCIQYNKLLLYSNMGLWTK